MQLLRRKKQCLRNQKKRKTNRTVKLWLKRKPKIKLPISDEAAWKIVMKNYGLCVYLAKKREGNGAEREDLVQELLVVFYEAVKGCDNPYNRRQLFSYVWKCLSKASFGIAEDLRWDEEQVRMDCRLYDMDPESLAEAGVSYECIRELMKAVRRDDRAAERAVDLSELKGRLRAKLTEKQYGLVEEFLAGASRLDAAIRRGVTRQAIEKRLPKIGDKIRWILLEYLELGDR